jgi:hypothetical protein
VLKFKIIAFIVLLLVEALVLWGVYPHTVYEQLVTGTFVIVGLAGHVITGVVLRRGRFDASAGQGFIWLFFRELFWLMFCAGVIGELWSFRETILLFIATWQAMPK